MGQRKSASSRTDIAHPAQAKVQPGAEKQLKRDFVVAGGVAAARVRGPGGPDVEKKNAVAPSEPREPLRRLVQPRAWPSHFA